MKAVQCWKITPHLSNRYDEAIIPVAEDPEGHRAIQYAQDVIENAWDIAEDMSEFKITVTLERVVLDEDEVPGDDEQ